MNPMILDVKDCEELSSIPGNTVIIATSQCSMSVFLLSIFSLLLRSENIYHIIVAINGPDSRTGDTSLQDEKQKFLEKLRNLSWHGKDMPLTIIRVWSRIGHTQSIEMAIPWAHTKYYTTMHDDTVILKEGWDTISSKVLDENHNVAVVYFRPLFISEIHLSKYDKKNKIYFEHFDSKLLVCRKSAIHEVGGHWWGYHIVKSGTAPKNFSYYRKEINQSVGQHGVDFIVEIIKNKLPRDKFEYDYLSYDVGSWINYKLLSKGYKFHGLPPEYIHHIGGASWARDEVKKHGELLLKTIRERLESELENYPEYLSLYKEYENHSNILL